MAIKLSNLTFTDEDNIASPSAVEQILNTEVANTLAADDDIIIGTGNDYGFENVSLLSTDDGNGTLTGIENLEPEFGSSYGIVNSGTLNADEDNDILTGTSRNNGILNYSWLTIYNIECLKNGADFFGSDDTYIKVNGTKIWGEYNMRRGQDRSVNFDYAPANFTTAWIELFDKDNGSRDDSMGGFTRVNTGGGIRIHQVHGSGSIYRVYYSAFG